MAVSSTQTSVSVTLTQAQQTVAVPFAFFAPSDLLVYSNGTLQTLGTHYEVTGGNGSTGSVVMLSGGPTIGAAIIIDRQIPNTHDGDFTAGGPLPGPALTKLFDRCVYLVQQLSAQIGRVVRFRLGTAPQPELSLTVPSVLGSLDGATLATLTATQLAEFLNLQGAVVDRPTRTFSNTAARNLAFPDFVGQLGVQLDQSGAAAIYISTATTAGAWTAGGTGATVSDGSITSVKLAAGAVTSNALAANSVTSSAIAAGAVGTDEIATGAVGTEELAAEAVTGAELAPNAVTVGKIADLAITAAKIVDRAILSIKIAVGAILTEHIADGAVTPAKIQNSPYGIRGRVYLTSGTNAPYNPSSGVRAIEVEAIGAGGGSGGKAADGTSPGSAASGVSGGGGGYAKTFHVIVPGHQYKYTIGAGGIAGTSNSSGGNGGTTTFFGGASGTTALASAGGGVGGAHGTALTTTQQGEQAFGGTGLIGDLLLTGTPSSRWVIYGDNFGGTERGTQVAFSDPGYPAIFAGGRNASIGGAAIVGNNYGVGGTAPFGQSGTIARSGAAGSGGLIIITEYY